MPGPVLIDQRERLEALLPLLPLPALLIEPETGRVVFGNEAASTLPLRPPASGNGSHHAPDAFDDQGRRIPEDQMPHRRAARGERLDGVQISWEVPEGRSSFLVYSGTIAAAHGLPPLAVLTFVDISRLKAAEDELRELVRHRDEFVSVATHELKDPLGALLLSIEVLKRTSEKHGAVPAAFVSQQLEISKRQGERLAQLIENLLDVSRIAHDRVRLDVEAFDLCELVRDVVARYQDQARAAGVPVVVEACKATIGYWDRLKIEQVVGNLVGNAIKYGARQPVAVRVASTPTDAVVEVEDRGIGIASEDHDRIFGRFERATRGHEERSLGLGLYIVRTLIELHGGTISLRSQPGQGSTFTVRLPRKRMPQTGGLGAEDDGKPGLP